MRNKFSVIMNGVALDALSPRLMIEDVSHVPAAVSREWERMIHREARYLKSSEWDGSQVKITFRLPVADPVARQHDLQKVLQWAREGGTLQTDDRPGQALRCVCDSLPEMTSVRKYTDPLTMVFKAYTLAFWEEIVPARISLSGTSGNGTLYIPGNAGDALAEVTATPTGSLENLTLTAGETSITLEGCGATASQPVRITYDEQGIQKIMRGNTSILNKRTAASADDLIVTCGKSNRFSFSASAAVNITYSVKGVWL